MLDAERFTEDSEGSEDEITAQKSFLILPLTVSAQFSTSVFGEEVFEVALG
jgi:hypothetical protein